MESIRMLNRLKLFLIESKQEFKRVNWPTWAETRRLTYIVIGLSIAVALFLGLLDFVFGYLLKVFFIA